MRIETAESYRDEEVVPRGGCGFIWRNDRGAHYVCEQTKGHNAPHRTGDVVFGACPTCGRPL